MVGVSSGGRIGPFGTLFDCGSIGGKSDGELLELFASGEAVEAAFEALVVRHGPTVLRACCRVLSDPNDADDAFQATFLVLARRAATGSIGRPDPLGSWLHGVALGVARKARVAAARRRRHEAKVAGCPDAGGPLADGLAAAVREEVERLPEPLRAPVVLCYLEDMTYRGAARQLRVSEGTIRGRLVRARSLLRSRLGRHEGLATTGRTEGQAPGGCLPRVPPALAAATIRAARALAPGGAGMASIPAAIAWLMEGVVMMTFVTRGILGALALAAVCLVAGGGAALTAKGDDAPSAAKAAAPGQGPREVGGQPNQPSDSLLVQILTLDDAIDRLLRTSLDLRSKFAEIPTARADVLTAGLRERPGSSADGPAFRMGQYAAMNSFDSRFVPVQDDPNPSSFDTRFAPPEFDINITRPTVLSAKRRVRTGAAKTVLEAQYQDDARNRIDQLYKLFVDVQEAQELARRAEADSPWWDRLWEEVRRRGEEGRGPVYDIIPIEPGRNRAGHRLAEARADLVRKRKALGSLLELPAHQAGGLEVEELRFTAPTIPTRESLERLALDTRPDLAALRLALDEMRASVDVASKRSSRYGDVYLLQQPYSFQGLNVADRGDARSFALGVTVPLPVYNRDHGNVSRHRINIDQARVELARMERQVISEVAERLPGVGALSPLALRSRIMPLRRAFQEEERRYEAGEGQVDDVVRSRKALEQAELIYLHALARYRRNLLSLNTAVSARFFP
jgi:cobalt-zinc-cadmium efflux system outer membrane protein